MTTKQRAALNEMFYSDTPAGTVVIHKQIKYIVANCHGAAHSNAYIDNCMICLNWHWGKILVSE